MNHKPVIEWVTWLRCMGAKVPAVAVHLLIVHCVEEGERIKRGIPLDDQALDAPLPYGWGERRYEEDS